MTQRGLQFARVLPALFAFFIQPPNVTGVFPFINPVIFETTYLGQTIKEVTFGGVLACLPVLWILFFAPPLLRVRRKVRQTNTVMGVIIVLIVVAVLIAILDAQMAGISVLKVLLIFIYVPIFCLDSTIPTSSSCLNTF